MKAPLTGGTTQARGMAASLLRYANREKVAQALTEQGYSVSRATVNRWARGAEMPEIAARMIGVLFGHADAKEAPPPTWATGLIEDVAATRGGVEGVEIELAALRAALGAIQSGLLPPDDDPLGDPPPARTVRRQRR